MPTAIVTGGSRGIGKETAKLLAKRNVNLVICSRTESEVQDAAKELQSIHPKILGLCCDVGTSNNVQHLVSIAVRRLGSIDVLINNAGVASSKALINTTEQEWDETINSNLKGTFLCSKYVLPHMLSAQKGTIVNVSSGAGKTGFEMLSAYCASKFGVIGLTESLAWEVAGTGIRVMSICPGEVDTKMQQIQGRSYYLAHKHEMLKASDVAQKIIDMIFDPASYYNGVSVDI
jgi:3-oxoacyl-[acyl-carrier protein] reductase